MSYRHLLILVFIITLNACGDEQVNSTNVMSDQIGSNPVQLFEYRSPSESGVDFVNELVETEALNTYTFNYFLNGGGSAIADLNNDGLQDLVFTSNLGNDQIYLNLGDLKFKNVTPTSGIKSGNWSSGVTIADINADGFLDIYICKGSTINSPQQNANLLYINNGDMTFTEAASKYGIGCNGYSVHSSFFDYDLDGDLDLYVTQFPKDTSGELVQRRPNQYETDRLFKNNGNGTFTDVTIEAGIMNYGHSLGLAVGDLNNDNYPDLYIGNDFQYPDFAYFNQKGKSFVDRTKQRFQHTSEFSMGNDMADIDNDGLIDIFSADMNPADNFRSKASMPSMNPKKFWNRVDKGFHLQYMRNQLHKNQGNGTFSEIGRQLKIANTDWSWAPLIADFNNDGNKDLYVTNGYFRDVQNKEFTKLLKKWEFEGVKKTRMQIVNELPQIKINNFMFSNQGDLKFEDKTGTWLDAKKSFSNGASYGDLDNDGDIDIVVNNINDPAFVLENKTSNKNYVRVALKGNKINSQGIGAKVVLKTSEGMQYAEMYTSRGFQSTSEAFIHFGLGDLNSTKSLEVYWPDGKYQIISSPMVGHVSIIDRNDATLDKTYKPSSASPIKFMKSKNSNGIDFRHKENTFDDYAKQVLLPHKMSNYGPALAVADYNGDGLDDVYLGGAKGQSSYLYDQQSDGSFKANNTFQFLASQEDVAAHFFDASLDGSPELYVSVGDADPATSQVEFGDRFYLNQKAQKQLVPFMKAVPAKSNAGGPVMDWDFDGDGDRDLIVGSRVQPDQYPLSPETSLFLNVNNGFTDVSTTTGVNLSKIGMTSAFSTIDLDGDGKEELISCGEWNSIKVFSYKDDKIQEVTDNYLARKMIGWWYSMHKADLDGDGDLDLICGNLGTNYKYYASDEKPFKVFAKDFDTNGSTDIVLGYNYNDKIYPVRGLQCSSEQMPFVKEEISNYNVFGNSTIEDIYGDRLDDALIINANEFKSLILWNDGGKLTPEALPAAAQSFPIFGIDTDDLDSDGDLDIVIAGNLKIAEVETGNNDAGKGLTLLNSSNKKFEVLHPYQTGLYTDGDVRAIKIINTAKGKILLVANNNDRAEIYEVN